jgi:lipopolysaccharide biosynthesis protein
VKYSPLFSLPTVTNIKLSQRKKRAWRHLLQDLLCLLAADGDMASDLLVTAEKEEGFYKLRILKLAKFETLQGSVD